MYIQITTEYCFEWDNNKNHLNQKKHDLSFETAQHIFIDPFMLSWLDDRFDYDEERWIGLGAIFKVVIIRLLSKP